MSTQPRTDVERLAAIDAYANDPRFPEVVSLREQAYAIEQQALGLTMTAEDARTRDLDTTELDAVADAYRQQAHDLNELSNEVYDLIHAELDLDDGHDGKRSAAESVALTPEQAGERIQLSEGIGPAEDNGPLQERAVASVPVRNDRYREIGIGADLASRIATARAVGDAMPGADRSAELLRTEPGEEIDSDHVRRAEAAERDDVEVARESVEQPEHEPPQHHDAAEVEAGTTPEIEPPAPEVEAPEVDEGRDTERMAAAVARADDAVSHADTALRTPEPEPDAERTVEMPAPHLERDIDAGRDSGMEIA